MEQKEETEKKIFQPKPGIEPGTFRFEVSHSNQSATDGIKILQKIFGYRSKVYSRAKIFGRFWWAPERGTKK